MRKLPKLLIPGRLEQIKGDRVDQQCKIRVQGKMIKLFSNCKTQYNTVITDYIARYQTQAM